MANFSGTIYSKTLDMRTHHDQMSAFMHDACQQSQYGNSKPSSTRKQRVRTARNKNRNSITVLPIRSSSTIQYCSRVYKFTVDQVSKMKMRPG